MRYFAPPAYRRQAQYDKEWFVRNVSYLINDIIKSGKNYGFMIRLQDEFPYRATVIASSDHPDSTTHPKLVVYYTN